MIFLSIVLKGVFWIGEKIIIFSVIVGVFFVMIEMIVEVVYYFDDVVFL